MAFIQNVLRNSLPWIILLVLGLYVSLFLVLNGIEKSRVQYYAPAFSDLNKADGLISFTTWWKSSGGDVVVKMHDGGVVTMNCRGPYVDAPCNMKIIDGKWVDLSNEYSGKDATVWWYPIANRSDYGSLYQMKIGDVLLVSYEEQIRKYKDEYNGGPGRGDFIFAIIVFLISVPTSLIQIYKRKV